MNFVQPDIFNRSVAFVSNLYDKLESKFASISHSKLSGNISWILVILICFSILLILNIFTPMTADDFGYLYIHAEDGARVTSIGDIFQSQYNHYYLWGGRSVVHFIAQALLLLPPFVIDLLNTLAYMAYVFLIYWFIKGRKAGSILLFILVNLAIWFVQPAFGDTILWITGSANYLWGTTLILLFLLPFRLYSGHKQDRISMIIYSVAFFIFAFIAGWTNENTAGAMLLMAILFLIYYRSRKWNIPVWAIVGLIGALIGYIIMIFAPGNAVRAGEAGQLGMFIICYRLLMHTLTLFTDYGILILSYLVILVLSGRFSREESKDSLQLSLIFLVGALAAIYAMIFSPSFPPRAWFGILTFFIIAIGILFYNFDYKNKFLRQIRVSMLTVGLIAFAFSFYLAAKDVSRFYSVYKERQLLVEKAKREGATTCEFERYIADTKFVHTEEVLSRHMMHGYYGIEIIFKESLQE
ncbi:DUF6056 family protein [Dysgonomonas sp. ZJ709]|uniref:DUF3329 domain-containing protein n=1 Tax=Dysgonomonas sp. ZJ709 TaxID=2709797 RepID=UPI0013EB767B|nr:DUF6056 family protein [Dysgonomonas sp. ZJ709]